MSNKETFVCSLCAETYEMTWSDEEALEELKGTFPGFNKEDCSVVCADCYERRGLGKKKT